MLDTIYIPFMKSLKKDCRCKSYIYTNGTRGLTIIAE